MKRLLNRFKKLKKSYKLFIVFLLIGLLMIPSFSIARYIYRISIDHFYSTKNFYFKSDFLAKNNPKYTISSWSGVDSYELGINMNSISNELKKADSDIEYDIEYTCEDTVTCTISKESGVIRGNDGTDSSNKDYFSLVLMPKKAFANNQETTIHIKATSTRPYVEEISATFVLKVEKAGLTYEITDKEKDIYAVLRLTNSLSYYTVNEDFLNYVAGDEIPQEVYINLSNENKNKCSSMSVSINFDPRVIQLDMTNAYYLKALKNNSIRTDNYYIIKKSDKGYEENALISVSDYNKLSDKSIATGPYEYVTGFDLTIEAISSADVLFYKVDTKMDYSYPFVNEDSIIDVE